MLLDLPNITATDTVAAVEEIKSYIYKSNEQINLALANTTPEKIWEQSAESLATLNGNSNVVSDDEKKKYINLRNLIIKTGNEVFVSEDKLNKVLSGVYSVKSEFGSYLLNTQLEIIGTSRSVEELFTYAAQADKYKIFNQSTFKRGLLSDEGVVPPVYGIEIGLLEYDYTQNDKGDITDSNKFLRITPDGISLWRNQIEIAHIDATAIYFPNAHITGGEISIGSDGNGDAGFEVDSSGNLTTRGTVNIGNNFNVDANGNVTAKNARLTSCYIDVAADAVGFNFYSETRSNQLGGAGSATSIETSNKGVAFNANGNAKFIQMGNLIYQAKNGYFSNSAKGLYVTDDYFAASGVTRNWSETYTGSFAVDGKTLTFKCGLLIGVQ